jgi:hypothetical protein
MTQIEATMKQLKKTKKMLGAHFPDSVLTNGTSRPVADIQGSSVDKATKDNWRKKYQQKIPWLMDTVVGMSQDYYEETAMHIQNATAKVKTEGETLSGELEILTDLKKQRCCKQGTPPNFSNIGVLFFFLGGLAYDRHLIKKKCNE